MNVFKSVWKKAFSILGEHFFYTLGIWFCSAVLMAIFAFTVIGILFIPALYAGALKIVLAKSKGEACKFGDIFSYFPRFFPFFFAGFLKFIGIALGFICLIVPGLYLMTRWAFVFPLMIEQNLGVKEAFSRSSQMTGKDPWPVFQVMVIVEIVSLLIQANLVSFVLLGSIQAVALTALYRQYLPKDETMIEIIPE